MNLTTDSSVFQKDKTTEQVMFFDNLLKSEELKQSERKSLLSSKNTKVLQQKLKQKLKREEKRVKQKTNQNDNQCCEEKCQIF